MAVLAIGGVLLVFGALARWNPWKLVMLDTAVASSSMLVGVAVVGLTVWWTTRGRNRLVSRLSALFGGAATALLCLGLLVFALFKLNAWSGQVIDRTTVRGPDGYSVVRTVWSTGALHGCVDFEVREGKGLLARNGERTSCVDVTGMSTTSWLVSFEGETVVMTLWNGDRCTYAIDPDGLELVPLDAEPCRELEP